MKPENLKRSSVVKVQKSNALISAKYKLNLWEMRIFIKMVMMVDHTDPENMEYKISLKELVDNFDLDGQRASYVRLRKGAASLQDRTIIFDRKDPETGDDIIVRAKFLSSIQTRVGGKNSNYITVKFDSLLRPLLLDLKEYTAYELRYILKLPTAYSVRVYELLTSNKYRTFTQFEIGLDELKQQIGAVETEYDSAKNELVVIKDNYPKFGAFRQKILLKSQEHLKEFTDISFEFEPIKEGRKVAKIRFDVTRKPEHALPLESGKIPELTPEDIGGEEDTIVAGIYAKVKQYVEEANVRKWVRTYPEEQIIAGINYTYQQLRDGKDIKNIGGYLQTMVAMDTLMAKANAEADKKQLAADKAAGKKAELEALKVEYAKVQAELSAKTDDIIRGIFDRHPEAKQGAFNLATRKRGSGYDKDKTAAENMTNPVFRAIFRSNVRQHHPEHFGALAELEQRSKALRGKISRLG
jgi:plasmid replication initiation protein